jgi:cobalt transport protein ATP-binding subunit
MAIIDVKQISFTYPEAQGPALADVSLTVGEGDVLFLLGVNGSGKTSLLQHLNGLLQPERGSVTLDGVPLTRYRDKELFSRVGLVFQDPNDQLFSPTVGEDVIFGPYNLGLSEAEARERMREALALAGLAGFESRQVRSLSYGQKKRAALAGILAMQPEVLLLDEPTAGIDPVGAVRIMELVRELNVSRKLSVVVTTHDVDLAAVFARHVCLLAGGRMVAAGRPEEILGNAGAMRSAGLRLPRLAHLAEILCKQDGAQAAYLPLTIGQARKWLQEERNRKSGENDAANL